MRVTPNLDSLGSFIICNPPDPDMIQTYPKVAFGDSNYLVIWSDEKFSASSYYYICATRVTPGGAVLDTGICISTGVGSSEYRGDVAWDGNRWLAVWPKSSIIQGRFVNAQGQPEDNVLTIATGGANGPAIAFDGSNYLVVYHTGSWPNYNICGQLVSPQGNLVGSEITIALDVGDTLRWPNVTFDGTDYLTVWMTGQNSPGPNYIYGQGIAPDGSLIGSNFLISDNTSSMRWWPVVAASDSNYLACWGQGFSSDVYGNCDYALVGVQENEERHSKTPFSGPTLFTGSLVPVREQGYVIFDISGRRITADHVQPGVYFIRKDDRAAHKIVIVK